MRQVVLRIGFLSLLFTSCGGDPAVPSGINPSQSDSPPVSGSYSLKSSDCKTTSSPLLIGQNLGVLTFRGGFDYGVSEWTGYVLSSDEKIYFTIPGTTETLTCQATLTDTELEGSCSLTSGGSCSFSFTRTGDIPPAGQDQDGDGITDDKDNCPTVANGEQGDIDQDGKGDGCDEDRDGDGVPNNKDSCPTSPNPYVPIASVGYRQEDFDNDGIGDPCDSDVDGDGIPNEEDPSNCEFLGDTVECAEGKTPGGDSAIKDTDGDGLNDLEDNCPFDVNLDQEDSNYDGVGDTCQDKYANKDFDNDGVLNQYDNCLVVANPDQKDSNQDGIGDACEQQ